MHRALTKILSQPDLGTWFLIIASKLKIKRNKGWGGYSERCGKCRNWLNLFVINLLWYRQLVIGEMLTVQLSTWLKSSKSIMEATYPPYPCPTAQILLLSINLNVSLRYVRTASWSCTSIDPILFWISRRIRSPWKPDPRASIWATT